MSDLTDHLEVLLRRYAADCDSQPPNADLDGLDEEFGREIDLLIDKYGQAAVDKAIHALPHARWPSVLLHWGAGLWVGSHGDDPITTLSSSPSILDPVRQVDGFAVQPLQSLQHRTRGAR